MEGINVGDCIETLARQLFNGLVVAANLRDGPTVAWGHVLRRVLELAAEKHEETAL
jgi:hypothetical protein